MDVMRLLSRINGDGNGGKSVRKELEQSMDRLNRTEDMYVECGDYDMKRGTTDRQRGKKKGRYVEWTKQEGMGVKLGTSEATTNSSTTDWT